jgi:hypothetical protein
MVEAFLGLGEDGHAGEEGLADAARAVMRERAERIAGEITAQPPISGDAVATIRARVSERQAAVGYAGDYAAWIEKHT